jgi:hypothetical protein
MYEEVVLDVNPIAITVEQPVPEDLKNLTEEQVLEVIKNNELANIRRIRDQLLVDTDWTQLEDVPQATRDKWKPYRQALRDITETYSSLDDVVWPTKPD